MWSTCNIIEASASEQVPHPTWSQQIIIIIIRIARSTSPVVAELMRHEWSWCGNVIRELYANYASSHYTHFSLTTPYFYTATAANY